MKIQEQNSLALAEQTNNECLKKFVISDPGSSGLAGNLQHPGRHSVQVSHINLSLGKEKAESGADILS